MEITCVKGERIYLTDNRSQTFMGIVKSVNATLGRLLLSDVVQLPENKSITGYRNFDKDEIQVIKKCEPDPEAVLESTEPTKVNKVIKLQVKVPESSIRPSESALNFSQPIQNEKQHQSEYCYISDFGTNFHLAISLLRACPTIGVYAKDSSQGRFKRVSVIALSTPSNIFVFDLQVLGDDVLHKGLREILESQSIIKVVHDSRLLSDCLKHKHLIELENVRDVEAEDIMVVFQERRTIRKHSRSLAYLLKVYLGVELEECYDTGEVWEERPLQLKLLEKLVSFASFLIPLQEAIVQKFLQQLINASKIYNNYVRDLDFFDVMYSESKKTLKKEMSKLVDPQNQVRGAFISKKIS